MLKKTYRKKSPTTGVMLSDLEEGVDGKLYYPNSIDIDIVPFLDSLNRIDGIQTIYSCAGHHDRHDEYDRETYISMICENITSLAKLIDVLKSSVIKWEIELTARNVKGLNPDQIALRISHTFDTADTRDDELKRLIDALEGKRRTVTRKNIVRVLSDECYAPGEQLIQFIPKEFQDTDKICETVKSHCHPFFLDYPFFLCGESGTTEPKRFISCRSRQDFEKMTSKNPGLNGPSPLINAYSVSEDEFNRLCQILGVNTMYIPRIEYMNGI